MAEVLLEDGRREERRRRLQLYSQVPDLRACCVRTATIGPHTKVVGYMKEAQRQYGEQTRGKRGKRGRGLGTPDSWAFLALAKAGAEEMPDTIDGAAFTNIFGDYTTPCALRRGRRQGGVQPRPRAEGARAHDCHVIGESR